MSKIFFLLVLIICCWPDYMLSQSLEIPADTLNPEFYDPETDSEYFEEEIPYYEETIITDSTEFYQFDREKWLKIKEDLNYEEESPPEKNEPKKQRNSVFDRPGMQTLLFILAIAALAFVVFFIARHFLFDKSEKVKVQKKPKTQEEALDIHQEDLEARLVEAESAQDYRLALRYRFLILLRSLENKKIIHWSREKTNRHYLREATGHPNYPLIRYLVLVFEQSWYGGRPIKKEFYQDLQNKFSQFEAHTKGKAA